MTNEKTKMQALCAEQLPELRGMFERILCVSRSSDGPTVGNIELADRLIDAVVSWSENSLAQPESDPSQLSDGFHTFAELYEHRHALCLALMRAMPEYCWFSWRHADGERCFGGDDWFIAGIELPAGESVTYHMPAELFQIAQATGAAELEKGRPWDGHSAADVVLRLKAWATLAQPETPSRLHHCPTHGQQPENAWGCPECVREMRQQLAQPEPEEPTDEEVADEARKYLVNEYALPAEITYFLDSDNFEYEPTIGCFRAVLARFGRPAIKPVPQEVEELIQCLRSREHSLTQEGASLRDRGDGIYFGRAADMLTLLARPAIKPVPAADLPPRIGHVFRLAEIIREVDGNHDKGAAVLAEAILSHPGSRWGPAIGLVPTSEPGVKP